MTILLPEVHDACCSLLVGRVANRGGSGVGIRGNKF